MSSLLSVWVLQLFPSLIQYALWKWQLYSNSYYKKGFYEVFHFYKTFFFTKAYEHFSCASAVGLLISGIYIGRTLKNRPGHSEMLHSIIMHVENAQAHGGAFICFWLLYMNIKRQNSKMCLLYSQPRICNYFHLWYNMLYENENDIAIFTKKKECFLWSVSFLQNHFF